MLDAIECAQQTMLAREARCKEALLEAMLCQRRWTSVSSSLRDLLYNDFNEIHLFSKAEVTREHI